MKFYIMTESFFTTENNDIVKTDAESVDFASVFNFLHEIYHWCVAFLLSIY